MLKDKAVNWMSGLLGERVKRLYSPVSGFPHESDSMERAGLCPAALETQASRADGDRLHRPHEVLLCQRGWSFGVGRPTK